MRHPWAMALCSVAVLVTGAACSGTADPGADGPVTAAPSSPTTPTATSSDPAKPEAPVMPDLARQKTTAGAKAFVRYYVEVLNYAWIARSGGGILGVSSDKCELCRDIAEFVDSTTAHGGSQVGGEWQIDSASEIPGQSPDRPIINAQIRIARALFREDESSDPTPRPSREVSYDFYLIRQDGQWRTINLGS